MLAIRKETLKVVNPDTGNYEGIAAISGDKGESSYEVAKRNGFTGTEAEFLEEFVPDNILTSFESFKADNEDVKSRLTTLETTVAELDVPDTSEDVETLQSDVSGLQTRMTAVEGVNSSQGTSIANLTGRVSNIENSLSNTSATITIPNNMSGHNCIYRGDNLTNRYTIEDICQRISAGTFDDLFIGDYFDIQVSTSYQANETIRCVIMEFTKSLHDNTTNVAIIMPRNPFYAKTSSRYEIRWVSPGHDSTISSSIPDGEKIWNSDLTDGIMIRYRDAIKNIFSSHLKPLSRNYPNCNMILPTLTMLTENYSIVSELSSMEYATSGTHLNSMTGYFEHPGCMNNSGNFQLPYKISGFGNYYSSSSYPAGSGSIVYQNTIESNNPSFAMRTQLNHQLKGFTYDPSLFKCTSKYISGSSIYLRPSPSYGETYYVFSIDTNGNLLLNANGTSWGVRPIFAIG